MKKLLAMLLALVMTLALAACGGTTGTDTQGETPSGTNDAAQTEDKLAVALVVAGTFGDRSFYDSSKAGVDRLAADFEKIDVKTIECNNENHDHQLRNAADSAKIVVAVGWEFYNIETIAPEYPDVDFIWIDNATSAPVSNVLNITYAQNEGSFLVGYVAAKMSESGVVGAVGGEDSATINDFIVGFTQGAKHANADIKVETIYSNTYDDPAIGKECAITLNDKGADVIFQIASKCGDGVFEAAKEKGFYAIGVDSDQKYIDPEVIVCSMCKEVGDSIYDAVKQYMEKGDDCGLFGTTWIADMATGYVGLAYGEEGAVQQISDELKAEVEELAKKIVAGEIEVDTTR